MPQARSSYSSNAKKDSKNVEADSNSEIWEGILNPAEVLSQVGCFIGLVFGLLGHFSITYLSIAQGPGPVVFPPFEATGLNDDIWATLHKDMTEVAEVLNSMNKGDEYSSSSTARNNSTARRQSGGGR